MSAKETMKPELEFVAFVGIDWADQKHVWCLQAAGLRQREFGELEHKPETVEASVGEGNTILRSIFGFLLRNRVAVEKLRLWRKWCQFG